MALVCAEGRGVRVSPDYRDDLEGATTVQDPTHSDGRHAATAGSLTVADLLARRTEAERRAATDRATHVRDAAPEAVDQAGTPGGRLGRAVLAGGLSAVVVGSLAGAALNGSPAAPRPSPVGQPGVVAGTDALRPDVVGAELLGNGTAPDLAAPAEPVPDAASEAESPAGRAGQAAEGTGPAEGDPSSGRAPGVPTVDTVGLVEQFFASLPTRPESAVALLDPVLGTTDPGGFRQSWRDIRSVDVLQVSPQRDGRIRASVVLERTDGARLRTGHLLTVTEGPRPRITDVVLLSAQQL